MSDAREIYESLSNEFARKGIASNRFSELEKLFHLASDNEKLQPEWRKLNIKTIKELQSQLQTKDTLIKELTKANTPSRVMELLVKPLENENKALGDKIKELEKEVLRIRWKNENN